MLLTIMIAAAIVLLICLICVASYGRDQRVRADRLAKTVTADRELIGKLDGTIFNKNAEIRAHKAVIEAHQDAKAKLQAVIEAHQAAKAKLQADIANLTETCAAHVAVIERWINPPQDEEVIAPVVEVASKPTLPPRGAKGRFVKVEPR